MPERMIQDIVWQCPACGLNLSLDHSRLVCERAHSFDFAKEGYVNLLLAHQKKSKHPGDAKSMVLARKNFLEMGYYDFLANKIAQLLIPGHWLDIGCGEGYYIQKLSGHTSDVTWYGVDISKNAIQYAAKRKLAHWAVASNFSLPVLSDVIDGVLQIFSPADNEEVKRVLKPGGKLIKVTPGPNHLKELREMLYEKANLHSVSEPPGDFTLISTENISKIITLEDHKDISNLLAMTPYYWKGDIEAKASLASQKNLILTLDFTVQTFSLNSVSSLYGKN